MKLSSKTGHLETTTNTTNVSEKSIQSQGTSSSNWNKLKSNEKVPLSSQKKSKGILDFINQKLHQWPLWNKIFSSEAQIQVKKTPSPLIKIQTQIDKFHQKNFIRVIKIKDLPWHIFFSRGVVNQTYEYYHCKQDNMIYFYTAKSKRGCKGYKIFELPQINKFYHRNVFAIPYQIAFPLIEVDRKREICE